MQDCAGLSIGLGALTAVTAAAATYYVATRPEPNIIPPADLDDQSTVLQDGSRISKFCKDGQPMRYLFDDVTTTFEGFQRGIRESKNGPCLGTRSGPNLEYEWISYQEVYDRAHAFGSGLLADGVKPGNSTFIGIYSSNRSEWVITEQACNMFSMVAIPLYDTLGPDACTYIINQASLSHILVDKSAKVLSLLAKAKDTPSLKCIVLMDSASKEATAAAEKAGVKLLDFQNTMAEGKKNLREIMPPKESDLVTICYTSGTTGDPKGVMLTHANLVSNISSVGFSALKAIKICPDDVHLSYLPLAHMFERGMQLLCFMHGCRIGFFQGDIKKLTDDMQALKPTVFITVPRLLNRIYDRIAASVKNSTIKSKLLEFALASKTNEIRRCVVRKNSIWDKLLFGRVQNMLGGRVKIVITGSAPLESKVMEFVRAAFGCVIMEGYGQTEATAGITFSMPGDSSIGHVGCPLPCNKVKLVDVPEMDYYSKNDQGEVCCFGPNTCAGYFKNEAKTKEALDDDGWLHTGDIGEWLPNGTLKIIDRKKNIFKLAQGEYIATERIENTYMRSQYVAQAFVDGNSLKSYLVGVMVPDPEVMIDWAKGEGMPDNMNDICASPRVKEMILKDINAVGKAAGLKTFEQVVDIHLFPELFSLENNLLTPTFKNQRPNLRKRFKPIIDKLYEDHDAKLAS